MNGTSLEIVLGMNMQESPQTPEQVLEWFEGEEKAFRDHWLWKELKTTPEALFKKVADQLKENRVDPELWQKRLAEARTATQTRVNEQRQRYQKVNLRMMAGLKV